MQDGDEDLVMGTPPAKSTDYCRNVAMGGPTPTKGPFCFRESPPGYGASLEIRPKLLVLPGGRAISKFCPFYFGGVQDKW